MDAARAARLRRRAARMARAVGDYEVGLLLTGDREIRALNRDFRKQDKATDVLSFALFEGAAGEVSREAGLLGDVVISVETAARQARIHQRGVAARDALDRELIFLFSHGLCHLLGYDHQNDRQERDMNARMAELLALHGRALGDDDVRDSGPRRRRGRRRR